MSQYVHEYRKGEEHVSILQKGCLTYLLFLQHKQEKLNYDKIILEDDNLKKIKGLQTQHGLNRVT